MENKKGSSGTNIRFIKFRDNPYAIESEMEAIESEGKQGSKVLLEGIKTGSAKVSVILPSNWYRERVPPANTYIIVVTSLFLVPHSALVLVGGQVHYHAEQMKGNEVKNEFILK